MARSGINILSLPDKETAGEKRRLLLELGRAERWLVRAIRLWAQRRAGAAPEGRVEDWRVAFLASLEPVLTSGRRVQIADHAIDAALADFNAALGVLVVAPAKTWRFHHPGCLGLDADETLLLDLLRLVAGRDISAARALLGTQIRGDDGIRRSGRALNYLVESARALGEMGLSLPRRRATQVSLTLASLH